MQHQGQRHGEGGHHDQRIGCDEKVRRLECKKMRPSWRGHCPHGDCHDEVSDSEKAPGVCCPVRANYVSCQQRSHDDGNDARRDVSSATSARSSGVRLPFLTRLKSSGLPTATRCRIFRIMPRVAGVSGRSRTRPILLRPSPINVARWLQSRANGQNNSAHRWPVRLRSCQNASNEPPFASRLLLALWRRASRNLCRTTECRRRTKDAD